MHWVGQKMSQKNLNEHFGQPYMYIYIINSLHCTLETNTKL